MQEIITGIKKETGIDIVWQKGKETKSIFFSYAELIDLKINALDLLEHPKRYLLDVDKHKIVMK